MGCVSVSHEIAGEFSGVWPRPACGLEYERDEVDVWVSVEFALFSSFGHASRAGAGCSNEGWVAVKRSYNGNIQVRGGTFDVEDEVHARVLPLTVHDAGESWNLLFDEYLGATV